MKGAKLLIWLTQLGLSVAVPMGGFILVALWLRSRFHWGAWVIVVGVVLGLIGAVDGLRNSLKIMEQMSKTEDETPPPTAFDTHE